MARVINRLQEYATKEYWNKRYEIDPAPFDWFKGYEQLKPVFDKLLPKSAKILMSGCGNSKLSEEMFDAGYLSIVNVDFSEVVIETMKERCKDRPQMQWIVADVKNMNSFADGEFDIIIDKGTLDAIMGDVWELDPIIAAEIDKACTEVSRVLKSGGIFIYITFGQPHFRKPVLSKPEYHWTLEVETIGEFFHYFIYAMRKQQ